MRVSMRTAVWTVMWRPLAILAPLRHLVGPYFSRSYLGPGISFLFREMSVSLWGTLALSSVVIPELVERR